MHRTLSPRRLKMVFAAALLITLSAAAGITYSNAKARAGFDAAARAADNVARPRGGTSGEVTMTASTASQTNVAGARTAPRLLSLTGMVAAVLLCLFSAVTASAQEGPRDETHQTFQLAGGARVEVRNVSGHLEIETAEAGTAEVSVVRTARSEGDLKYHQVTVEQTPTGLLVRGLEDREAYKRGRQVQQYVKLRLPRDVSLSIKGVGGGVTIGEVDGEVQAERVGGTLEVSLAGAGLEVSNVGGHLRAGLPGTGQRGIRISSVGGHVELRFRHEPNADLEASSVSGRLFADVPDVVMLEPESSVRTRARIGAGGAQLSINKVGGDVRLTQDPRPHSGQ
jgi:Putative adhesin